jgi:hypothetical protein
MTTQHVGDVNDNHDILRCKTMRHSYDMVSNYFLIIYKILVQPRQYKSQDTRLRSFKTQEISEPR